MNARWLIFVVSVLAVTLGQLSAVSKSNDGLQSPFAQFDIGATFAPDTESSDDSHVGFDVPQLPRILLVSMFASTNCFHSAKQNSPVAIRAPPVTH